MYINKYRATYPDGEKVALQGFPYKFDLWDCDRAAGTFSIDGEHRYRFGGDLRTWLDERRITDYYIAPFAMVVGFKKLADSREFRVAWAKA